MSDEAGDEKKSFEVPVKVWFNEQDLHFRLVFPGGRITTVSSDHRLERGHPHLYAHLRSMLDEQKRSGG